MVKTDCSKENKKKKKKINAYGTDNLEKLLIVIPKLSGFPQVALVVKNPPINAEDKRDVGSISALGRSPGGEHGNLLQYSCLEDPID